MSSLDHSGERLRVGARVELLARSIDEEGHGVGHTRAGELRAANVLPGERCEVLIAHVSPHQARAWGRVTRRLSRVSPQRVTPLCPSWGACGGCPWQHLAYSAQLERKRQRVIDALAAAAVDLAGARVAAVVAAPRVEGYRNVAKYVAREPPDGARRQVILGSYVPRGHDVVDMARCRVVEPIIERVRSAASRALARLPVYRSDAAGTSGALRYVAVRSGANGRAVLAIVTAGAGGRPGLAEDVTRVAAALGEHPEVAGVMWFQNDAHSGVILAGEARCVVGRDSVVERVAGVELDVGVGDFFQINRGQAARLYAEVTRLAGSYSSDGAGSGRVTERIIDLYCGVGGIGFALARAGPTREILGIEHSESSIRAAQIAATRAALGGRVRFRAAPADELAAVSAEVYGAEVPDLIVVNPPRKGLDPGVRRRLLAIDPLRLMYVSCNPETLARDLAALVAPRGPYRIDEIVPIDLMPGTSHVETVVALSQPG